MVARGTKTGTLRPTVMSDGGMEIFVLLLIISELIWQTHDLLLLLNKRILRIVCQTTVFLYC